jgi:hypothetical protein
LLSLFSASYPELLAYLHQPDLINRDALSANGYEQFYARIAPFTTPLLSMLLLCSTYLTVLVSGDRYFLICWPLIAEKIRTRKMAVYLVLLVFLAVNIYILPHWFEYRTKARKIQKIDSATNLTLNNTAVPDDVVVVEVAYTELGKNKIYASIYRFYLNVPITFVIPFTLLTLCNGSMIHQLSLIKKQKKRLGHRMKADIRITIMLIIIVLTFMLCRSINLFVNLLVQFTPCLNNNSLQQYNTFANLFVAFNGFVNFFLFAAFGQRFREMVLYIFFRHGQYPFPTDLEGPNTHRFPPIANTPTNDYLRRQSRRLSVTENDVWTAITRRRSSASMATFYNPQDIRPVPLSNSNTNSSPFHIPPTSNLSANPAETPLLDSSNQQLPTSEPRNKLIIPHRNHHDKNSIETKALNDQTLSPNFHVTFV